MSDGRFAVLGPTTSCEALAFDDADAHWGHLPPMHDARRHFACGSVAGCVIVAGGDGLKSAEVYDAELDRWYVAASVRFALRKFARLYGQHGSVGRTGNVLAYA